MNHSQNKNLSLPTQSLFLTFFMVILTSFTATPGFSISKSTSESMRKIYKLALEMGEKVESDCESILKTSYAISDEAKGLKSHFNLSPSYKISYNNFERNLKEIRYACKNKNKNKEYRRSLYKGLLSSCFHCHSADKIDNSGIHAKINLSPKLRSEILLSTRNYKALKRDINKFFAKPEKDKIPFYEELEQKLYLKVKVSPDKLKKSLTARMQTLPERKKLYQNWIRKLNSLDKIDERHEVFKKADRLVKRKIGLFADEEELIDLYYLSGKLVQYLHTSEKDQAARILYYLGSLENRIDHTHYSVDNLFLIECLQNYKKHAYAKFCYQELKDQVEFSFTGSRGTELPTSVSKLLKELKPRL